MAGDKKTKYHLKGWERARAPRKQAILKQNNSFKKARMLVAVDFLEKRLVRVASDDFVHHQAEDPHLSSAAIVELD